MIHSLKHNYNNILICINVLNFKIKVYLFRKCVSYKISNVIHKINYYLPIIIFMYEYSKSTYYSIVLTF